MSRRREVEHHLASLTEIREIMVAMKNLALIEARRLDKYLENQRNMLHDIETMAADFRHHYGLISGESRLHLYLLVGSERGFCGAFNHRLIEHYQAQLSKEDTPDSLAVAIGNKLASSIPEEVAIAEQLDGASTPEEVSKVLNRLFDVIMRQQQQHGVISCTVLHHDHEGDVVSYPLLPPFTQLAVTEKAPPLPPMITLPPQLLLRELVEQYLLAALQTILTTSLLAENQQRVAHLTSGVRHLDDRNVELGRKLRGLRQEEIIEEIEVLLINTEQATARTQRPVPG